MAQINHTTRGVCLIYDDDSLSCRHSETTRKYSVLPIQRWRHQRFDVLSHRLFEPAGSATTNHEIVYELIIRHHYSSGMPTETQFQSSSVICPVQINFSLLQHVGTVLTRNVFLLEIQSRPALWDMSLPVYADRNSKKNSWKQVP